MLAPGVARARRRRARVRADIIKSRAAAWCPGFGRRRRSLSRAWRRYGAGLCMGGATSNSRDEVRYFIDIPACRTALLDAGEWAVTLQRASLDLLQRFHGGNAAQLAHHVLAMPLDCLDALRQFAGNSLVGESQLHLLERGPLDFAELGDLLLDG